MGKRIPLAPETIERIRDMRRAGKSVREVMEELGVAYRTVVKHSKGLGHATRKLTDEDKELIRTYRFQGKEIRWICEQLGVSRTLVHRWSPGAEELIEAGVKIAGRATKADRRRIRLARLAGLSIEATAMMLDVTEHTVERYSPSPEEIEAAGAGDHLDYWGKVGASEEPIFYPEDLPELDWTDGGFNWTTEELNTATAVARMVLDGRASLDLAA